MHPFSALSSECYLFPLHQLPVRRVQYNGLADLYLGHSNQLLYNQSVNLFVQKCNRHWTGH